MGTETKGRGRQTVTLPPPLPPRRVPRRITSKGGGKEDGRSGGLRGPVARAGGLQGAELRWP